MKTIPQLTRITSIALLSGILVFSACKKESSSDSAADKETYAAATGQAQSEADVVFDDVFNNVVGVDAEVGVGAGVGIFSSSTTTDGAVETNGVNGADSTRCFTVSYTQLAAPARFPLQITLDFGTGCTARDGRTRKGKIITVYTGPLIISGNSSTTTFDGYQVDSIKVQGTHKVQNVSSSNNRAFKITVTGAKLTKPNGNYSEWNSEKTITQTEGNGTPLFPLDDVFSVTGASNGAVQKNGLLFQWSTEVTNPLIKKFLCRWFVQGTVVLRKSNSPVAELNYGTGTCDNKATLTVNGVVREITLP